MRKTLAIMGAGASIFMLAACGGTHDTPGDPSSLVGEWHQTGKNPNGWMTATIDEGSIQINLNGRESRSIFWLGTFDGTHKPTGTFKITSLGDPDAAKNKIAMSPDKTKVFTYEEGDLSYEFSALGSSTIVHLVKNKD